ncbi:LamG-like jellyroll fold domain-containing protein [Verrucomicrobium sp. BvORR106]|uniref:malectin domain-containing carbohydrate-binding protein n=1 Tax=Verrucomicrobium sp. BvORR106 TaxID=1403819 RepID=UPI00056EA257|nr:LamG-like jellyroll fold domain-containing protein [Verrucomicrobium sp. BvORR106]
MTFRSTAFTVALSTALLACFASTHHAAPAVARPFEALRINCGGGTIKDRLTGHVWLSDKNYVVRGKKYRFSQRLNLKGTEEPAPEPVYQSVRRANVTYRIRSVADGTYLVRLHFVDGKQQAERSMDFWIEGEHLLQNFSPREAAGSPNRAYIYEAVVQVKDGNGLEIRGTRGRGDDVFLSGIEVLPAPSGAPLTRPPLASPSAPADLAQQLRDFAEGPARVVWTRTEDEEDFYLKGGTGTLFGYDTEDGKGERAILSELRSYASPMLTPDGRQVVFTHQTKHKCYVVGFDGANLRELSAGYASDIWSDPATGVTWVYVRTGWRDVRAPVRRFRLDDPSVSEEVWTKSGTGQPQTAWFHLSGDGKLAADAFPWPQCGLADMGTGEFKVMGKGCWPAVAPDSSHRSFYFIGQHTGVQFFDTPQATPRTINLATVPGWTGRKVYHPRWTNDVRFVTLTAPQWMPETELYIGRFDQGFTEVESWFRVTYNHTADFFGDAWFAAASKHNAPSAPGTPTPALLAQSNDNGLPGTVFIWENERSRNVITAADAKVLRSWSARYEGATRPNRWFGAMIRHGSLLPDDDAAPVFAKAAESSGAFSLALDIEPSVGAGRQESAVLSLASSKQKPVLELVQNQSALSVSLLGKDRKLVNLSLGDVTPGEPTQVAVSYGAGQLVGYRDGKEKARVAAVCDPGTWEAANLVFGNDVLRGKPWEGSMENIRLLDRELSGSEIAALQERSVKTRQERQPAARVVVEAELLQASEPDEPATIAPYVRSLGENVYKVKRVLSGHLEDTEIIVLQWVVLGGQTLPSSEREEGHVYRLELESADNHPELSGEHRSTDIFEPVMNVYYDMGL